MVRKNKEFDVQWSWVQIPPLLLNFWDLTALSLNSPSLEWGNDNSYLRVVGEIQ